MDYWVMIVDDGALVRMAAVYAISRLYSAGQHSTWRLVEARGADTAMSLALDGRVDITLIDHNTPGRDGLSLAANLRHLYPAMPIALMTANSQPETIAGAKELDLTFIPKPRWKDGLAAFLSAAM
ncbi:response regulator transcription factor, partial [Acidisphaera sp. S103]|uniref:response regulator transcription factor n=1 Tax=Acidisphaera sp. S103 TaxID=1747223 RepID=UPI00131CE43E